MINKNSFLFLTCIIYFFNLSAYCEDFKTKFMSIDKKEANLRIGASTDYPIILRYNTLNLPLIILEEESDWKKIRDIEENEGWVHKRWLSNKRYGIINSKYENHVQIYKKPEGKIIGKVGENNIVFLNECIKDWCLVEIGLYSGWINKINIWGVNPNEKFGNPFYFEIRKYYWEFF